MREEFEAARVTNLFGSGHSLDAAMELSAQMQGLQRYGPEGMARAQELLINTREDFNQAGFGQNIIDVPVSGAFGQRIGTTVYMNTDAGPQRVADLMYQPGFADGCDTLGYGLAGMRVGGFGGRFGTAVDLRIGNFDLSLFSGGRPGFGVESANYYAPQQGWQNAFQSYLARQNLDYGQVQQSLVKYQPGTTTIINNETTINNKSVAIDNSKHIGTINNINSHPTTVNESSTITNQRTTNFGQRTTNFGQRTTNVEAQAPGTIANPAAGKPVANPFGLTAVNPAMQFKHPPAVAQPVEATTGGASNGYQQTKRLPSALPNEAAPITPTNANAQALEAQKQAHLREQAEALKAQQAEALKAQQAEALKAQQAATLKAQQAATLKAQQLEQQNAARRVVTTQPALPTAQPRPAARVEIAPHVQQVTAPPAHENKEVKKKP